MNADWQAPAFAAASWYSDPDDPRCPLDARLDALEIHEHKPPADARGEKRKPDIVLRLLGAHGHDGGAIVFSYFGVRRHSLCAYLCDQGSGAWLRDEFEKAEDGRVTHRITWRSETGGISRWWIEAERIELAHVAGPDSRGKRNW